MCWRRRLKCCINNFGEKANDVVRAETMFDRKIHSTQKSRRFKIVGWAALCSEKKSFSVNGLVDKFCCFVFNPKDKLIWIIIPTLCINHFKCKYNYVLYFRVQMIVLRYLLEKLFRFSWNLHLTSSTKIRSNPAEIFSWDCMEV